MIIIISACALLLACGSSGSDDPAPVLQSISILPSDLSLPSGQTRQLSAMGSYSDGRTADLTGSATWASSAGEVATVSSAGLAAAVAPGSTTITATTEGVTGQFQLSVPALQSIVISPANGAVIPLAQTRQFTAAGIYADGQSLDISGLVAWSASPASVASISTAGLASATASGIATIAATREGVSANALLTVDSPSGWSIEIVRPAHGGPVASILKVAVIASAPTEIQSARATVGDVSAALAFVTDDPDCQLLEDLRPCWSGTMNVPGLSRGPHTLTVTVTDATGDSVSWMQQIVHDEQPIIQVSQPAPNTVVPGTLRLAASCSDDDPAGCVSLSAFVCPGENCDSPAAQGVSDVDARVDMTAHDGEVGRITYVARDSAGQSVRVVIPIHIESSSRLQAIEQVPGLIVDADATRILYLDHSRASLYLRDRTQDTDVFLATDPSGSIANPGFLTPAGAVFPICRSFSAYDCDLQSWESGTLIDLGPIDSAHSLEGAGPYVIWNSPTTLRRRDVSAQSTIDISSTAGNIYNDVGSNGAVAFWSGNPSNISFYRPDGTTTALTSDTVLGNSYPRTDGTSVLYRRHEGLCCSDPTFELVLNSAGVEEQLVAPTQYELDPLEDYQIAAGWIAYRKPGPSNVLQVWRRDPLGQQSQLSFFGNHSFLDVLGQDGSLVFFNERRRYLAAPGGTTFTEIGSHLGKTLFIGGQPHVAIGNTLFSVQ